MFGVIQSPPAPAKPDFDMQLWHEQIVPTSGNTKTRKCQKTTGCHSSRCAFSYGFFVYVYINIVSQRQPLMITRKSRHQLQTSTKIEKKEKKKNSFRTSFTGNTQKTHQNYGRIGVNDCRGETAAHQICWPRKGKSILYIACHHSTRMLILLCVSFRSILIQPNQPNMVQTDMSTVVACILLHWTPSLGQRIHPWQCAVKRIANLHMARCHTERTDGTCARCQSRYTASRYVFWFCPRLSRPIRSGLSDAWNWCHLFRPTYCRWKFDSCTSEIHHRRLFGHQYYATESIAATTAKIKAILGEQWTRHRQAHISFIHYRQLHSYLYCHLPYSNPPTHVKCFLHKFLLFSSL